MKFETLCEKVFNLCKNKSDNKLHSESLEKEIFNLPVKEFMPLVIEAGSIPESIPHDSSEEKLFTKATEIILAKSFQELGLKAETIKKRSGCADVIAKSIFHNYTLVADAKAFRLSRTAKNQKDFKVEAMDQWRKDNDYAVLVCPYFQYPKNTSQIFEQAITKNVLLFSWENIHFLLENKITESKNLDLSFIWNQSNLMAPTITADKLQNSFIEIQNENITKKLGLQYSDFIFALKKSKESIINRSSKEISYWLDKLKEIQNYSREKAIKELVTTLKIHEKINAITSYSNSLRGDNDDE
ncbi:MAG: HindIII family type II restriction endonuclease [Treponema sp.]|nr:HindIII family type II restriction endonuclease [Treponema sp.]